MNQVDRGRVRAAFSRSAARYDAHASVQRAVQDRVLELVSGAAPAARRVLDVGAGTGALLARMAAASPGLVAAAVDFAPGMCAAARAAAPGALVAAADAEALPFRDAAFDLVVSTSTFQWLPRLGPAFAEARRVLAPGGIAVIALFGARTLHELRGACRGASNGAARSRLHRFFSRENVAAALAASGLAPRQVLEEEIVEHHPDSRTVLRGLKAIGASNAVPGARGLGGRAATLEMLRRYDEDHAGSGGVPATYHVVYAVGAQAAN